MLYKYIYIYIYICIYYSLCDSYTCIYTYIYKCIYTVCVYMYIYTAVYISMDFCRSASPLLCFKCSASASPVIPVVSFTCAVHVGPSWPFGP